jgi:hypothetical protein
MFKLSQVVKVKGVPTAGFGKRYDYLYCTGEPLARIVVTLGDIYFAPPEGRAIGYKERILELEKQARVVTGKTYGGLQQLVKEKGYGEPFA